MLNRRAIITIGINQLHTITNDVKRAFKELDLFVWHIETNHAEGKIYYYVESDLLPEVAEGVALVTCELVIIYDGLVKPKYDYAYINHPRGIIRQEVN